jgi:hypothetical protein
VCRVAGGKKGKKDDEVAGGLVSSNGSADGLGLSTSGITISSAVPTSNIAVNSVPGLPPLASSSLPSSSSGAHDPNDPFAEFFKSTGGGGGGGGGGSSKADPLVGL